jgi:hypothetical protein
VTAGLDCVEVDNIPQHIELRLGIEVGDCVNPKKERRRNKAAEISDAYQFELYDVNQEVPVEHVTNVI